MPDNVCCGEKVSSLLELSAQAFAETYDDDNYPGNAFGICRLVHGSPSSPFILPAPVGQCLWRAFRQLGRENQAFSFFLKTTVNHGHSLPETPLEDMDLSGSHCISDTVFLDLLKLHSKTLARINVSECSSLTGDVSTGKVVFGPDRSAKSPCLSLPSLTILDLGNQVSLFLPWIEEQMQIKAFNEEVNFSMNRQRCMAPEQNPDINYIDTNSSGYVGPSNEIESVSSDSDMGEDVEMSDVSNLATNNSHGSNEASIDNCDMINDSNDLRDDTGIQTMNSCSCSMDTFGDTHPEDQVETRCDNADQTACFGETSAAMDNKSDNLIITLDNPNDSEKISSAVDQSPLSKLDNGANTSFSKDYLGQPNVCAHCICKHASSSKERNECGIMQNNNRDKTCTIHGTPTGNKKVVCKYMDSTRMCACRQQKTNIRNGVHFVNIFTGLSPALKSLTLTGELGHEVFEDHLEVVQQFFTMLISPVKSSLRYLDLTSWNFDPVSGGLNWLPRLLSNGLTTLILHDVPQMTECINLLHGMKQLRNLDISQSDTETGEYSRPALTLFTLVNSLPHLESLDISSTNLANHPEYKSDNWWPSDDACKIESDIVGLRGLKQRLKFLGLYNCGEACSYARLPADQVTGDLYEHQILLALERYVKSGRLLRRVLSDAYRTYRYTETTQSARALNLVLTGMERHTLDVNVQVSGTAALYYMMHNVTFSPTSKKRVVQGFLTALKNHMNENLLVRNCCLSLCQFDIPDDLMFVYEDATHMLVKALGCHPDDTMTLRILVYVLNSMACHVDGERKLVAGNIGAISNILDLIRKRVEDATCDDVMEVSWSFLWNITDETPDNCKRFLNHDGMSLFLDCLSKFGDKTDLLRNMMGLMGNIAEVEALRSRLMVTDYVTAFCDLLKNLSDGIEISYNSAGVLAHLCSAGEQLWSSLPSPSRDKVMADIVDATAAWDLNAKRFINYRSFEPIFRLVPLYDCYAAQYWALWALANLTSVDPHKFCCFVVDEGGMPLLNEVVQRNPIHRQTMGDVITATELAQKVIHNVTRWGQRRFASADDTPIVAVVGDDVEMI